MLWRMRTFARYPCILSQFHFLHSLHSPFDLLIVQMPIFDFFIVQMLILPTKGQTRQVPKHCRSSLSKQISGVHSQSKLIHNIFNNYPCSWHLAALRAILGQLQQRELLLQVPGEWAECPQVQLQRPTSAIPRHVYCFCPAGISARSDCDTALFRGKQPCRAMTV